MINREILNFGREIGKEHHSIRELDCRGLACPGPVFQTKEWLDHFLDKKQLGETTNMLDIITTAIQLVAKVIKPYQNLISLL